MELPKGWNGVVMIRWLVRTVLATPLVIVSVSNCQAQDLPLHSVSFSPDEAACRIVLEPDATTGNGPARLFLSSDMMKPSLAFGLDGSGIADAVIVRKGERHPFVSQQGLAPNDLLADPIWALLDPGADAKNSLYLTVRNGDGGYSSARYDHLSHDGILRLLALACRPTGLDSPALTPVEHSAAEVRLALSDADRVHIRRLLSALYGTDGVDVGKSGVFNVTDRRFIAQFNAEQKYPSGDYLWPASVPDMLKTTVNDATQAAPMPAGSAELVRHADWSVLGDSAGSLCRITTIATAQEGLETGLRMEFSVDSKGSGGMMAIDLVTPNPFRADAPLAAMIDGTGFGLVVEPKTGALIPQPLSDGSMTNDLVKALRFGKSVEIGGVAKATNAPSRLSFSLLGFSAAFKDMASACNRPGIMGWIE